MLAALTSCECRKRQGQKPCLNVIHFENALPKNFLLVALVSLALGFQGQEIILLNSCC